MSVADFLAELRPRVAGELRDDLYSRTLYSTDASLYQVMPYGVLIPRHGDDMQAAVELAAKHLVPLLPRGRQQPRRAIGQHGIGAGHLALS